MKMIKLIIFMILMLIFFIVFFNWNNIEKEKRMAIEENLCNSNDLNYVPYNVGGKCYKQTGDFVEFVEIVKINNNYYILVEE